jgi:hypothetical protein
VIAGAGDGNRTRVISLEGWGSTIELLPPEQTGTTCRRNIGARLPIRTHITSIRWWRRLDSNQRTRKRADLQSAAFNHSATPPDGSNSMPLRGGSGGAKRDRTADLYNAIVALSQLSYGPNLWNTHVMGDVVFSCLVSLPLTDISPALRGACTCGCRSGLTWMKRWSGRRDSNPRPQPWQGCALPLSYAREFRVVCLS